MERRRFLDAAVTGGLLGLAGCSDTSDWGGLPTAGRDRNRNRTPEPDTGTDARPNKNSADADPADFVWAEQALWRDERVRENLFAFAGRNRLAVVVAKADAGIGDVPEIEDALAAAARHGVEAWLNVGVLKSLDATAFVADADRRQRHLDGLAAVVASYREFFPTGRIVLWQEAPVGGRWVESGAWNDEAVSNLERLGPEIFAAQERRVRQVAPDVDIGIFVHFPYIVDGKKPETFVTLTHGLEDRDALPDFTFTDFYRGWYAKDVGPGPANNTVKSLVTNARTATDGRPVIYLGEAHTIDPNYTPSKQANWMDLRAALGAGAEGIGWYARTGYSPTKRGFDPFVPNTGPAARDGPRASTLTFARDRYQYAYAALRAKRRRDASDDAFDLWLVGRDFSFYDHRLSVRTRQDDWAFVGDFDGYLDGNYPYGRGGHTVSVFRGLPRARYDRNARLELAVETSPNSDGAHLAAVLAMPTSAECFLTASAAAAAYDAQDHLDAHSLGRTVADVALKPRDSRRVDVTLTEPEQPLEALVFPNHRAQRERLRALESQSEFVPADAFDLWVRTNQHTDETDRTNGLGALALVGDTGRRTLDDASTARSTTHRGAVFYGLDRADLGHRDGSVALELAGDARGAVTEAYAMPYAGTVAFRPATEAMNLLDADSASARTFAIAFVGE